MTSFAFSCVVDDVPSLLAQAFIWVNCLKRLQQVDPRDIFVHVVDVDDVGFLDWLKAEHVNLVPVERFDRRNPYCNKVRQLPTFVGSGYDQVVLMDCDTAWVGHAPLPLGSPLAGCIVDHANPPEPILRDIFAAAGLGEPNWTAARFALSDRKLTDRNNLNGGLYIFDGNFAAKLAEAWTDRATWCLDRSPLFQSFAMHADQVSFALALRDLGADAHHLPIEWNYPTHLPPAALPDLSPEIIHYHGLTPEFGLKPVGLAQVDASIARLSDHIAQFIDRAPRSVRLPQPAAGAAGFGKVVVGSGWWCDGKDHD